ncbi:MAG: AMP-binding protein [Defluviitaleaceae bacterium]|nr:AMP-binding protein [Defluviitaleaceae bacterium]
MNVKAIQYGAPLVISDKFKCVADFLLCAADEHPYKGINYFNESGHTTFLSYINLVEKSRKCLNALNIKGIKRGDIIIVDIVDPINFFITFWACVLGGIIVAPISHPTSTELTSPGMAKLFKVWKTLNKPTIIIEEHRRKTYKNIIEDEIYCDLKLLSFNELNSSEMADVVRTDINDLLVIQFSSGSTGTPKGVMLTNKNILTGVISISRCLESEEDDTVCTWLPHTHDMGLFGQLLTPVAAGNNIYVCLPMTFIRAPQLFLQNVARHKVKWFFCTNFGFEWMNKNISDEKLSSLDLTSLKYIMNGAEPISVSVTNQFIEKFGRAGFKPEMMRPGYGLAEATLGVSISIVGDSPIIDRVLRKQFVNEGIAVVSHFQDKQDVLLLVHVGIPFDGISVRIADDKGYLLNEEMVGEVQIKGDSVTSGYYRNDEANANLFVDGWLRTGDLGFMRNGSLVICGRKKDIIIVNGQNYYSHDLEEALYELGIFQRGNIAIVGLYNPVSQQEEVILFFKGKFDNKKYPKMYGHVISKMYDLFGIKITYIIPVSKIPKTTSGKLQRFELRSCYENGDYNEFIGNFLNQQRSLNILYESPENQLETLLCKIWSDVLDIPEKNISMSSSFVTLGGNSVKAYKVHGEIERHLQEEIDTELLIKCHTIREMRIYLEARSAVSDANHTTPSVKCNNVAVTGIGIRLPDASTPDEFWYNLTNGKDSIDKVSSVRKHLSNNYLWDDWIGELENINMFDNDFFEMNVEDAKFTDPQQKLGLEVSYEALEEAGMTPFLGEKLNIAVFSAISANSYLQLVHKYIQNNGLDQIRSNTMIGNLNNMVSSILSYTFNFTSEAVNIDTACSSFLVAFNYAVEAIKNGKCDGALVVGANILTNSSVHDLSKRAGIVASTRFSKVFDKDADGTILGEGVIALFLEPLDKAERERKNIYATSKGGAVNNNGRTFAVMAPDPAGQHQVLVDAYKNSETDPGEISYIEAHGTGTTIGDPIEIRALTKLFAGHHNNEKNKIGIGSVKTNIGHLLSTAGGAGLVKLLLCLKNKKLVPSLHLNTINPALELEKTPFYVVKENIEWDIDEQEIRKAGISSFGLGGTNAHTILEEFKSSKLHVSSDFQVLPLLTISAKTESACENNILSIEELIKKDNGLNVADICYTCNRFRMHYQYRAAFVINEMNKDKNIMLIDKKYKRLRSNCRVGLFIEDIDFSSIRWNETSCTVLKNHVDKVTALAHELGIEETMVESHRLKSIIALFAMSKVLLETVTFEFVSGVGSGHLLASLLNSKVNDADTLKALINYNMQDIKHCELGDVDIAVILTLKNPNDSKPRENLTPISIPASLDSANLENTLLNILGKLYVNGIDPNWDILHPNGTGALIRLPSYAFEHKSIWLES